MEQRLWQYAAYEFSNSHEVQRSADFQFLLQSQLERRRRWGILSSVFAKQGRSVRFQGPLMYSYRAGGVWRDYNVDGFGKMAT